MPTYPTLIPLIQSFVDECGRLGIGDQLPKGGLNAIILANHLDHEVIPGDKRADALDRVTGLKYEYKVSCTDQFAFHCGTRETKRKKTIAEIITRKFSNTEGAYCAARKGTRIAEVAYCSFAHLTPYLIEHFSRTAGSQLNKVFSMDAFLAVDGARKFSVVPTAP